MTYEERQMVLELHILLKKKLYGNTKGNIVARGNRKRAYITKEDTSYPTFRT